MKSYFAFYDNAGEIGLFISGGEIRPILPPPKRVQHFGCICDMDLEFFLEKQKLAWPGKKKYFLWKTKNDKKNCNWKFWNPPKHQNLGILGCCIFTQSLVTFLSQIFWFFHCRVWSLFDHKFSDFFTAEFSHLKLVIKKRQNAAVKF